VSLPAFFPGSDSGSTPSGTDLGAEFLLILFKTPFGRGAESAVLKSLSLRSPSAKSSASSELASKPANKLLILRGLLIEPAPGDKAPSSLLPGYESRTSMLGNSVGEDGIRELPLLRMRLGFRGGGGAPGVKGSGPRMDSDGDGGAETILDG
jgi:hypothetical protein